MIAIVIAAFVAGWVVRATVGVPERAITVADRWVLNVALPAMVVARIGRIEVGSELVVPVASAWGVMGASACAVVVIARIAGWRRETTGALLMVAVLGNTSFLGLGVVGSVLGVDHLAAAVAYDQPGTFLALATWGAWVASRFGTGAPGWRPVVSRIVRFPPFVALLAALALRPVGLPDAAWYVLGAVGLTVAPVAMAALGARFRLRGIVDPGPVVVGLAVKMVCAPLAVACAAAVVGGSSAVAWQASIVQASAPPMVTAGIVAVAAGLDEETTTSLVGWGTVIGLVSMPLVAVLV